MHCAVDFRLVECLHRAGRCSAAFAFALALVFGAGAPVNAQEKLTSAQEQSMAQCLAGCKKGDASCQNACTGKNASPVYAAATESCVRACADALAGPGQQEQSRVGDLVQCVRACN